MEKVARIFYVSLVWRARLEGKSSVSGDMQASILPSVWEIGMSDLKPEPLMYRNDGPDKVSIQIFGRWFDLNPGDQITISAPLHFSVQPNDRDFRVFPE